MTTTRLLSVLLVSCLLVAPINLVHAAGPLKESALVALVEAGFDDEEIVAKIKKEGLAFDASDEAIERLKAVGASDTVLEAIQSAKRLTLDASKPVVTFESIIKLLENDVDSDFIIAKLRKSPGVYTLSAEQEEQLRAAGASNALIQAMKQGVKEDSAAEPISDLAIVLDVSGSMKETTADGRPKIDAAKEVIGELVRQIPEGLNVSVVIYGHTQGCSAVKVMRGLVELKPSQKDALVSEIQSLTPVGNTPIALALQRAGEQFAGRKTHCGIVLVTDGLESCNGDPAAEAAKLAENPLLRFGVNVVGFGLKPEESTATAAIAEAGKGKYYDAQDREQLLAAVGEVTKKLERGAEPAPFNPANPKGRRAIIVTSPKVKFPTLKRVVLVKPKASYYTVDSYKINEVAKYDMELRQPSAEPVDIWWVPETGLPVLMVTEFENPEREVKQLRPEEYLGLVKVTSDEPSADTKVVVTKPDTSEGTVDTYKVQEITGLNQDLVLPVGTYMLWIVEPDQKPTLLEEEVQVAGGKVTAIEK